MRTHIQTVFEACNSSPFHFIYLNYNAVKTLVNTGFCENITYLVNTTSTNFIEVRTYVDGKLTMSILVSTFVSIGGLFCRP